MTATLIVTSLFALFFGLGALGLAYWLKGAIKQKKKEAIKSNELKEVFSS